MDNPTDLNGTQQGFGFSKLDRIPIPERDAMSEAQRAAADSIINGPRKSIFGPFVPLLQTPVFARQLPDSAGPGGQRITPADAMRRRRICRGQRQRDLVRPLLGTAPKHWHEDRAMMTTGYKPHTRRSPLTDPWEPLLSRQTADALYLALEIREAHCNSRGFAHGGLISALADYAMGHSATLQARRRSGAEKANAVTVSLTLDFIDTALVGDCVEFQPTVLKVGRTLAFVECRVVCGERLIARGSATFRMV